MAASETTLRWRGFELAFRDDDSWSVLYDDGYIGVSCDAEFESEPEKHWSALIECGEISGDGVGQTANAALEAARRDLFQSVTDHAALIARHFPEVP